VKLVIERQPINERRPTTTLTLSEERGEQIRMIAAAHNLTITELLARFINLEIRRGTIPDEIPGYRIKCVDRHVEISIKKATIRATASEAKSIAEGIEQSAGDPIFLAQSQLKDKSTLFAFYGDNWIDTSGGDNVLVRRRGRGLIIEFNKYKKRTAARRSLSPDVAYDLARLIRVAAKKAANR
jgi:hypothetical protein